MAKRSSRWLDIVIAVGVVATVVRLWGAVSVKEWLNPPAPLLAIGQSFPLGVNDRDRDRTLVLFVDSACPACRASVAFYRELTRLAHGADPPLRVVALAPADRVDPTRQWLDDSGLSQVAIIRVEKPWLTGFAATPTIVLVDHEWNIQDIALGQLTLAEQQQLIGFALSDRGSPVNKTPIELSESACAEATESPEIQLLDVRSREELRIDASSRAKSIPFEELSLRAMAELQPGRRTVVLSRSNADRGRQAAIELRIMGFSDVNLCSF